MESQDLKGLFEAAKGVDIDRFLSATLGVKPTTSNGWLRYSSCPACGESSKDSVKLSTRNGYWRCWGCREDGDVIDAAAWIFGTGKDKLAAAKKLLDEFSSGSFAALPLRPSNHQNDEDDAQRHQAFERILVGLRGMDFGSELPAPTLRYLTVTRALPRELVMAAYRKGLVLGLPTEPRAIRHLLETHFAKSDLEKSKLWKAGAKMPGIAFRPLVFPLPGGTSAEFRVIDERYLKEGTKKAIRYGKTLRPWVWEGTDPTKPVLIVEGILDMLSVVALGHSGDVIGLPGVNSWADHVQDWFGHLKGRRVVVCFDNDPEKSGLIKNPGQHWAQRLLAALTELGVKQADNKLLPVGVDANKILQARTAQARSVA